MLVLLILLLLVVVVQQELQAQEVKVQVQHYFLLLLWVVVADQTPGGWASLTHAHMHGSVVVKGADGNLHVNIMYHRADQAETRAAEKAVQLLMETVVSLGGAISGEHGIGLAKTPFFPIAK